MNGQTSKTVEKFISSSDLTKKELVNKIRDVILSYDDEIQEDIKWGNIAFSNGGNFAALRVSPIQVTLVFFEGAKLNDIYGVLEKGINAKTRRMTFKTNDDLKVHIIQDLVAQAIALNRVKKN